MLQSIPLQISNSIDSHYLENTGKDNITKICFSPSVYQDHFQIRPTHSGRIPNDYPFFYGIPLQVSHFTLYITKTIHENIADENFNVQALATCVHLSRKQLLHRIKKETGYTSHAFLSGTKLHYARTLLHQTDLNISEIAYKTGYKDPAHFSKMFKKRFGCAPREERRNMEV